MSFFGFDTSLPRDKQNSSSGPGIFEHRDPFAGIAQARKLQALQDNEEEEYVVLRCLSFPANIIELDSTSMIPTMDSVTSFMKRETISTMTPLVVGLTEVFHLARLAEILISLATPLKSPMQWARSR